jgi:hypothetical protein
MTIWIAVIGAMVFALASPMQFAHHLVDELLYHADMEMKKM